MSDEKKNGAEDRFKSSLNDLINESKIKILDVSIGDLNEVDEFSSLNVRVLNVVSIDLNNYNIMEDLIRKFRITHNAQVIMILGSSGKGKSTLCNFIINKKILETSDGQNDVTTRIQIIFCKSMILIDLPGFNFNLRAWWNCINALSITHKVIMFPIIDGRVTNSLPIYDMIQMMKFLDKNDCYKIVSRVPVDEDVINVDEYKNYLNIKIKDGKMTNSSLILDFIKSKEDGFKLFSPSGLLDELNNLKNKVNRYVEIKKELEKDMTVIQTTAKNVARSGESYEDIPSEIAVKIESKGKIKFESDVVSPIWKIASIIPLISLIPLIKQDNKAEMNKNQAYHVHGLNTANMIHFNNLDTMLKNGNNKLIIKFIRYLKQEKHIDIDGVYDEFIKSDDTGPDMVKIIVE